MFSTHKKQPPSCHSFSTCCLECIVFLFKFSLSSLLSFSFAPLGTEASESEETSTVEVTTETSFTEPTVDEARTEAEAEAEVTFSETTTFLSSSSPETETAAASEVEVETEPPTTEGVATPEAEGQSSFPFLALASFLVQITFAWTRFFCLYHRRRQ